MILTLVFDGICYVVVNSIVSIYCRHLYFRLCLFCYCNNFGKGYVPHWCLIWHVFHLYYDRNTRWRGRMMGVILNTQMLQANFVSNIYFTCASTLKLNSVIAS
jgi:hypothetical protein